MHTLTKPHIDHWSGLPEGANPPAPEQVEVRFQILLNEWLEHYFSGNPFTTRLPDGSTAQKSYQHADIRFGSVTMPENPERPLIHTIIADRRDGEGQSDGRGCLVHRGVWALHTFVRVHPTQPVRPSLSSTLEKDARRTSEQLCRRVAEQLSALIHGPDAADLAVKGIHDINITNGPREIPAAGWFIRQIVWTARPVYRVPI